MIYELIITISIIKHNVTINDEITLTSMPSSKKQLTILIKVNR